MKASQLLLFAGVSLLAAGCVSKTQYTRDIQGMQTHIGALTQEVSRLDGELRNAQSALQTAEMRNRSLSGELETVQGSLRTVSPASRPQALAPVGGAGIYRTPSGFQLASTDIQNALKGAGYYDGSIDGKIGPATRNAIRQFQTDNSLKADGVVGRRTWDKLKAYLDVIK